jgi:PAS domain S-box-containing protein
MTNDSEDQRLRTVAFENAQAILAARQRAEAELIQTRDALLASEARLRALFNQAAVGMAVADFDARFIEVNHAFAAFLGYRIDELRGLTFRDITSEQDLRLTEEAMASLRDGARKDFSIEKKYVRKDGTTFWGHLTVTLVSNNEGQPHQFIGVLVDISARRAAEEALQEETRVLEVLNQTGAQLSSSLELQSIVQKVTDAATAVSGAAFGAFFYNVTDATGARYHLFTLSGAPRSAFEKFGHPRATPLFGPTFAGGAPIRIGDVLADPRYGTMAPHQGMPAGHLPVRSYMAVAVSAPNGEVIGGLFFGHPEPDVFSERAERIVTGIAGQAGTAIDRARLFETARRAAEERRELLESERAARAAAERLSDVKDSFLATLSHELRTPLNAILGWAHVLQSSAGAAEPDMVKGLDTIVRNARMQAQMIDDLLDMSRITSGKLRLDVQPLQPIAFIEAAVDTVRPAANAKALRLDVLLDPAAGPISGDASRMQQVVWNLLSNAIKFTPRGGRVQVLLERVNSHIEITIADTGPGIQRDLLPHLFDRFKQGDASTTREFGGLGLGLSIVKNLVELHGGRVDISSGDGIPGTTAKVHLPLLVAHEQRGEARAHPRASGHTAAVPAVKELAGVRVLVVEDQVDARDLIDRILRDCGAEVSLAASGSEALASLERQQPDVIVSDIGMPGMDGYELMRRIRQRSDGGRIPSVALTAFARSEDRTRALRAGFSVHVSKPVDPAELIATVASVTGRT